MDVYVIHQTVSFYMFLWKDICRVDSWKNLSTELWIYILVSIGVYAGGSILGRLRVLTIEPIWVKSKLFAMLEKQMGKFYSE